jgi:hypothetical protein
VEEAMPLQTAETRSGGVLADAVPKGYFLNGEFGSRSRIEQNQEHGLLGELQPKTPTVLEISEGNG